MKKSIIVGSALLVLVLVGIVFFLGKGGSYPIDPSKHPVRFSSEDPSGVFTALHGEVLFDADSLEGSRFNVQVDVNSILTGHRTRDEHAKGKDWFDVEKYPTINFESSKIEKIEDEYSATGILTMHGIQKEIQIPFEVNQGSNPPTLEGVFEINRLDFQIGQPKHAAEILQIKLSVPITQQAL